MELLWIPLFKNRRKNTLTKFEIAYYLIVLQFHRLLAYVAHFMQLCATVSQFTFILHHFDFAKSFANLVSDLSFVYFFLVRAFPIW